MKKIIFVVMMLFAAGFAFSQARTVVDQEGIRPLRPDVGVGQSRVDSPGATVAEDPEIQEKLKKNEDYYNEFQDKFKTLRTFNNTKQQRDDFKAMQALVDRQKRLVDFKMEEIQIMERAGKTVPMSDFTQLKDFMNRYHQMTIDLNNWVNKIK